MENQVPEIVIKKSALADLEKEYDYYATQYSLKYAETFRSDFFNIVRGISYQPLRFPECRFLPTKRKIFRSITWNNYLIIFKLKKNLIEVLVLFHTKQHPVKIKTARKSK